MGIARGWGVDTDPEARARWSRVFLLAGLVACASSLLLGDPWRGWILVGLIAAAAGAGAVSVWHDRRPTNSAWLLTIGATLLVPAYLLWYPLRLQWDLEFSTPGITDVLFLGAYAFFLAGLAVLIHQRSTSDRRIDVLDSLIIGVGLSALVWVVYISPYLHDETMSWPARSVAISYTIIDLLLFGAVVRMLVQGGIASTGDRLLALWIVAQFSADMGYAVTSLQGRFALDHPVVTMYPLSFVLLGAALLHPTTTAPAARRERQSVSGHRRLAMVLPAPLIAPTVIAALGIQQGSSEIIVVALLSTVLFALVLGRVWILVNTNEEHERTRRQLTEAVEQERRRTEENQMLLVSLRERQMLSERLSRIQRKISTRAPLQEVLDAITLGAAELVHDDVAALRFLDEDDPDFMVMVSSVGVAPEVEHEVHRLPTGVGVGGRAITTNQLCIQDAYNQWDGAIGQFASGGLQTAMATPVHLGDRPIGSLVVATHRADRHYSPAEQEALISFAEHVSIALNDARSVRAMNEALESAVHQAMHDELTGLPNRACFYDRVEHALAALPRPESSTAVLLFDLDRFKEINDTLGHRYGDQVLRAIEGRVRPLLRTSDTLARLGGDEFCVLLTDVGGIDSAMDVASRITLALQEPLEIHGMSLVVEASCGVAVAPAHGTNADLLLQRSDIAMYDAKRSHHSTVLYDPALDANTPDRLALLAELRTALLRDELVIHYQPQVDVRSGEVEGVEALLRWQHPRRGLLGPEVFLPLAEETGLIHQVTSWVLDASLAQLRRWRDIGVPGVDTDFTMAVNLSTQSLLDESFATEVLTALDRFGVPADQLVLEITETTLMVDPDRARRVLTRLSGRGVRFAIDDFGTGYSSLALLKDLPVHDLKIDKSFVRFMHREADDMIIVRSVIDLGHTLGLRTVAEGVEHAEVMDCLGDLGCDMAQGFAIAPPMPAAEVMAWMHAAARGTARAEVS